MKMRRFTGVPVWVNWVHYVMEFLDYKVVSPISSWLVYRRVELIDRNCTCSVCEGRYRKGKAT